MNGNQTDNVAILTLAIHINETIDRYDFYETVPDTFPLDFRYSRKEERLE